METFRARPSAAAPRAPAPLRLSELVRGRSCRAHLARMHASTSRPSTISVSISLRIGVGARTAAAERAALRQSEKRRGHPENLRSGAPRPVAARYRADEAFRIGMQRPFEHLVDGALLDDLAGVHDAHLVGEARDDREIMGDPTSEVCRSRQSFCISNRICPWMVTSSAVVGSSAMIRSGRLMSAIAIATRWRMPPEN